MIIPILSPPFINIAACMHKQVGKIGKMSVTYTRSLHCFVPHKIAIYLQIGSYSYMHIRQ